MYSKLKDCFAKENMGSNFRGNVLVLECDRRATSAGSPYITMRVKDKETTVDCVRWNSSTVFAPGQVIRLVGTSGEYNGKLQLTIKGAQYAPEAPVEDFAISISNHSYKTILRLFGDIQDPLLLEQVMKLYNDYEEELVLAAGANKLHHGYAGGLMDHTLEVIKYAMGIYDLLPTETKQRTNHDVLLISAALHDFGKIQAYHVDKLTGVITPKAHYYASDHIISACKVIDRYIHHDNQLLIEHCIVSHHGRKEWGALREPSSLEATILHHADMLSAQLTHMLKAFAQPAQDGGWTKGKVFPFGRSIYVGHESGAHHDR